MGDNTEREITIRKLDLKDFPNYKRKLIVQNIPIEVTDDEIMNYFYTVLSTTAKEECKLVLKS